MRTILCWAGIIALAALAWSADDTPPAKKKATSPQKTVTKPAASAAKKKAAPSKTGVSKAATPASRRGKKGPPAKRVTWRNRQLAPTPQRYKEIQEALAAKGYLKPEDANGAWNQASVDALKKFQAGQNLDSTGKINSLSLIALGLGPRRETPAPKPPADGPAPER
jgi:hypothetical protein